MNANSKLFNLTNPRATTTKQQKEHTQFLLLSSLIHSGLSQWDAKKFVKLNPDLRTRGEERGGGGDDNGAEAVAEEEEVEKGYRFCLNQLKSDT
ncbi:hypothetical protein Droror1_Dr00014272 [Drosera rotundifolia]